jgi:hypothetical protein
METKVPFPIYVLLDDRLMLSIESPIRVLYHLEPIDIENDEYLFWDANGKGVRVSINRQKVHSIEYADNPITLIEAFRLYSQAIGVDVDMNGTIEVVWSRFKQAEAGLPRPKGVFSRLFRSSDG